MGIMIIPMVSSISEDSMSAVPDSLRQASYGLWATKFTPPEGLFSQTAAMPMQIFAWSDYAQPAFQRGVVAAGVVTLLIVLLTMNSIAILLRNKFEQEAY